MGQAVCRYSELQKKEPQMTEKIHGRRDRQTCRAYVCTHASELILCQRMHASFARVFCLYVYVYMDGRARESESERKIQQYNLHYPEQPTSMTFPAVAALKQTFLCDIKPICPVLGQCHSAS